MAPYHYIRDASHTECSLYTVTLKLMLETADTPKSIKLPRNPKHVANDLDVIYLDEFILICIKDESKHTGYS